MASHETIEDEAPLTWAEAAREMEERKAQKKAMWARLREYEKWLGDLPTELVPRLKGILDRYRAHGTTEPHLIGLCTLYGHKRKAVEAALQALRKDRLIRFKDYGIPGTPRRVRRWFAK